MRLIKLLLLGGVAAFVYRRFFAGSNEGVMETANAEPFSSEQLDDEPAAAAPEAPEGEAPAARNGDTITQPTWLKPADAG